MISQKAPRAVSQGLFLVAFAAENLNIMWFPYVHVSIICSSTAVSTCRSVGRSVCLCPTPLCVHIIIPAFIYSAMSDTMIMDAIASQLVLPNRLTVPLVADLHVAQLRSPLPRVTPFLLGPEKHGSTQTDANLSNLISEFQISIKSQTQSNNPCCPCTH